MEPTTRPGWLHATAVVLASLTIPAPVLGGRITEAVLDITNPAKLTDVSAGLAYLQEILVVGFSTLGVVVVAFVAVTGILWARTKSRSAVALPVIVFGVQVIVGIVFLIAGAVVDSAGG